MITLLTDFGNRSPYKAVMRGVIAQVNPAATVIDMSHEIPAQDLRHAAFYLLQTVPHFPRWTIHAIVVDPGVGTERAILIVKLLDQFLVVPDNGSWTWLAHYFGRPASVHRLNESRYWRPEISSTFHGRDIIAPVAAWLSCGVDPQCFGPEIRDWVILPPPRCEQSAQGVQGEIIFIDDFGNLITSIQSSAKSTAGILRLRDQTISRRVRTYADAPRGELIWLPSSSGFLEIARCQGNAAQHLGAAIGDNVKWSPAKEA